MKPKDTLDIEASFFAVAADAAAMFLGMLMATWIRLDSGMFPLLHDRPLNPYPVYAVGAAAAVAILLLVYAQLDLYARPQVGTFGDKIPRLVRGVGIGLLGATVLAFVVKNIYSFSTGVIMLSFFTVSAVVILERYLMLQVEAHAARESAVRNRVLILGTDSLAAHLRRALANEPCLRCDVTGFLRTDDEKPDPDIPSDLILGTADEFGRFADGEAKVDSVILCDTRMGYNRILDIILQCERSLISFKLVPDLFRILTNNVAIQTIGEVPLLGFGKWPLDYVWNRALKRVEDIAGSAIGLIVTAPIVALAAWWVKRTSPGPAFFRQERCGRHGKAFILYKLRTMEVDAEQKTGPVWATEEDPRRTRAGTYLRRYSIDELPQLWNVLKGDMSLVGPRPERPHFVEQFKGSIVRYMSRHTSRPGITGWAQVNGLRGNTSIEERIKADLYYLENWSLAFDFKILVKTLFAGENAY